MRPPCPPADVIWWAALWCAHSSVFLQALESVRHAAEELVEPLEWQGREGLSLKRAQEAAGLAAIRQMLHSQGTALR